MKRMQIDRILCPVDFSEYSAPALERAVRLGSWFGARVDAVHVIPFPVPAATGLPYIPVPPDVTQEQKEATAQHLANLVAPFLGEGVPIETKILEGDPWRVIRDEARGLPADLLVMGTHGRSGFEHLLLGSVTEKVLRHAPCPVLTVGHVPPHLRSGPLFRRILCAADLTESSDCTLAMALSVASENDAHITLLHVVEVIPDEQGRDLYLAVPEIGPLRRDLVEHARARLREAVPDAARDFCDVSERVETGSAWRGNPAGGGRNECRSHRDGRTCRGRARPDVLWLDVEPRGAPGRMPGPGDPRGESRATKIRGCRSGCDSAPREGGKATRMRLARVWDVYRGGSNPGASPCRVPRCRRHLGRSRYLDSRSWTGPWSRRPWARPTTPG